MNLIHFTEVLNIVQKLRDPEGGCPWDLKQNHQTLLKYLIEECYEFIDAVEKQDPEAMAQELGDVLLQVLLHSTIAKQNGSFDLEKISKILGDKLTRRHPHVFGEIVDGKKISPEEVIFNWNKIKEKEKTDLGIIPDSSFIPKKTMMAPALTSAYQIGVKSKEIKFDWDNASQVAYKVEEEWQELKEELSPQGAISKKRIKDEIGDLLFSVAQLARHLEIDPEEALKEANQKFITRFHYLESLVEKAGKDITKMNQKEMDVYWNQAKIDLKNE